MAPKKHEPAKCQVCSANASKYTCAQCKIVYCSVACYKSHKGQGLEALLKQSLLASSCGQQDNEKKPKEEEPLSDPVVLRPLTSLKWPYVPEESAYPDPLKRDDPKALQLSHYEAIATSPAIRRILESRQNLPALLESIDKLRGRDRDEALQRALRVTPTDVTTSSQPKEMSEDVLALRELAEAVEAAVRGQNSLALGLNWEGDA
ncbi:hypothetical protein FA15DRAFT_598811 [Coprinopsis marcescibilis]|uniref:HIT-type domain-containing protein n=1 Tax=Coprinopsis marcescibilis TaxID=230819 RepID=A0A5C3KLX2_COPMA|nr:hypothetical protein FA15DRAFT_598811 [Coprinopsis marcescibilis]